MVIGRSLFINAFNINVSFVVFICRVNIIFVVCDGWNFCFIKSSGS